LKPSTAQDIYVLFLKFKQSGVDGERKDSQNLIGQIGVDKNELLLLEMWRG
jgi:hypothetical protein